MRDPWSDGDPNLPELLTSSDEGTNGSVESYPGSLLSTTSTSHGDDDNEGSDDNDDDDDGDNQVSEDSERAEATNMHWEAAIQLQVHLGGPHRIALNWVRFVFLMWHRSSI